MSDLPERSPQGAAERWMMVVFLLGFLCLMGMVLFQSRDSLHVIAAQSFCLAAALGLVFTLVPHTVGTERGESWSDGLGILMSWQLPDSHFESWIGSPDGDGGFGS